MLNFQVFNFYSANLSPPPNKLSRAVNSFLPEDIRVLDVVRVSSDFHARHSALSKTYSFQIQLGPIADPLLLGLSQHVFQELDIDAMRSSPLRVLEAVSPAIPALPLSRIAYGLLSP